MKLAEDLPTGFRCREAGRATVVARADYLDLLAGTNTRELPVAGHGRGAVTRLAAPNGKSLLIRQYRRGGVLRYINKEKYLGPRRPLDEMRICREAAARGVPVAEVVGAIVEARGPFRLCSLVTEEIEDTIDLGEYICWLPAAPPREILAEKRNIIEATARAVRKMHDAGLYHADLQAKNILVRRTTKGVEVFFIDLDKSVIKEKLPERLRARNLRRLNRSIIKIQSALPPIDDADRRRFLKAYRAGDRIFGDVASPLLRSCRVQVALHRLSWRIFK